MTMLAAIAVYGYSIWNAIVIGVFVIAIWLIFNVYADKFGPRFVQVINILCGAAGIILVLGVLLSLAGLR